MNKEYDNNNKGSLWLSDKETIKGDKYYNGDINIEGKVYKITMFKNESNNPKAPVFKLKVNVPNGQVVQEPSREPSREEDQPYIDFGNTIELSDEDIAF
jgi:hypothetical protein